MIIRNLKNRLEMRCLNYGFCSIFLKNIFFANNVDQLNNEK